MKIIRREYFGIYIYANPKNKMERATTDARERQERFLCRQVE